MIVKTLLFHVTRKLVLTLLYYYSVYNEHSINKVTGKLSSLIGYGLGALPEELQAPTRVFILEYSLLKFPPQSSLENNILLLFLGEGRLYSRTKSPRDYYISIDDSVEDSRVEAKI